MTGQAFIRIHNLILYWTKQHLSEGFMIGQELVS